MEFPNLEPVSSVFARARRLSPEERGPFLDRECRGDDNLRREVESLLREEESLGGFLEKGVCRESLLEGLGGLIQETQSSLESDDTPMPERLGRYKIVRVIGAGGMGIVCEAEQDSPTRRVALKVLRAGFEIRETLKRFEREGQVLARLQHPGVAQIYDAGTFDLGGLPQPFIAMELVRGGTILEYADRTGLDRRARLGLVVQACDAVHWAHQQGVVHRDLKPGNILVDERGIPKIVDFGVAWMTNPEERSPRVLTATGDVIGTLSYMSPEQIAGRRGEVDGRSDVYALGVITFELLTGRLPQPVSELPLPEVMRRISEDTPPRLSSVDRTLRGDLDTIVEKALEKEPDRRYPTAAAFAADIRRYLANQPIAARPASFFYRLRKFSRRNRSFVAAVVIAFLSLVVGTAVAVRQAIEAHRQRDVAIRKAYVATMAFAARSLATDEPALVRKRLEAAPSALRGWEWRYVSARLDGSSLVLPATESELRALIFEPDKSALYGIEVSENGRWFLHRWLLGGTGSMEACREPLGADRPVPVRRSALASLVDSGRLSDAADGAGVVDRIKAQHIALMRCFCPGNEPCTVAAVSPDGGQAVLVESPEHRPADSGQIFVVCDLARGERWASCELPGKTEAVAIGSQGSFLVSFSDDSILRTLYPRTCSVETERRIPHDNESVVSFDSTGERLITGSVNGWVRLWNLPGGELITERRTHMGRNVTALSYDREGTLFASAGMDGTIRLWEPDLGRERAVLRGHKGRIDSMAFSPDGHMLASHAGDGTVRLWELEVFEGDPFVLEGHSSFVYGVAYSPDGKRIASISWDGTIRLWDAETGQVIAALPLTVPPGETSYGYCLAFHPDGTRLFTVTGEQGRVHLFDSRTGADLGEGMDLPKLGLPPVFHPDGSIVVGAVKGETYAALLDPTTLEVKRTLKGVKCPCAFSRDGKRLAAVSEEGGIAVLETDGWRVIRTLAEGLEENRRVRQIAWSPDGSRVVAVLKDAPFDCVWKVETGRLLNRIEGHAMPVNAVAWSPDGTRIATAGQSGAVRIFDADTFEELLQFRGHQSYVLSLAFSPDGKTLASASGDSTVRLWSTRPLADFLRARRRRQAFRPEASRMVTELLGKGLEPAAAADSLESEPGLDPELRETALQELLRRYAGACIFRPPEAPPPRGGIISNFNLPDLVLQGCSLPGDQESRAPDSTKIKSAPAVDCPTQFPAVLSIFPVTDAGAAEENLDFFRGKFRHFTHIRRGNSPCSSEDCGVSEKRRRELL